jgi:hypothetical protein
MSEEGEKEAKAVRVLIASSGMKAVRSGRKPRQRATRTV